ncbi:hypothetical protein [Pseudotabrizicola sp. L79]|uniref:hypothetical protein n=1 Tax=Pseudotabrizicola sp. L79 TaxID=3118402 RepID=UPI002F930538
MFNTKLLAALLVATALSGCLSTPTQRGVTGAVVGAAIADATDENMVAGAALGALAGAATCGIELGLPPCQSSY